MKDTIRIYMCNHGDSTSFVSGLLTYMSSLLAQALWIHDGVRMGVPMHTASWERKREIKNSTEEKQQMSRICSIFLWHPSVKPQDKSMFCISVLVKNVSCQSKPKRVAAEIKPKQIYSPNASDSCVTSLWTGKQCCLLHVTNITNVLLSMWCKT